MPDMLAKLYTLPPLEPALARCAAHGISIKRAIMPELERVAGFVAEHFGTGWVCEARGCFTNHPATIFVATRGQEILGFACYDTTCKDFFGPTGVAKKERGQGIGAALLLACLHDMRAQGYGYAIIGAVGPAEFYTKACGATVIEDSWPGVYEGLLGYAGDHWAEEEEE